MIRCVLFDSDGVVTNSDSICSQALAIAFADLQVSLDILEIERQLRGRRLEGTVDFFSEKHDIQLPGYFADQYQEIAWELLERNLNPVAGIEMFLKHSAFPMAAVSNGPMARLEKALNICQLTRFFGKRTYSAFDFGVWKPNPALYSLAAFDMGFDIKDCVVVESSSIGVEAAIKSGAKTLYYDIHDEYHGWPGVRSFSRMDELNNLVNEIHNQSRWGTSD